MKAQRIVVAALLAVAGATLADAQPTDNPHGALAVSCATCHRPDAWKPVRVTDAFKHAPATFPLEGAHASTTCMGCHERLDFRGVERSCASCHEDVHKGELGADCSRCHTPRSFAEDPGVMKRAHELTRFPLRGAHAVAACTACHAPGSSGQLQFVNRGTTCASCHLADAHAVTIPDHRSAGFTGECTSCHSIMTWKNPRFDHSQTAFPLVGAHQATTCEACHADRVYKGRDAQCVSCHRADYDQAANPRHADGFPVLCADCHATIEWKGARFDHQATTFPLTGAHAATTCAGCHGDGLYAGKPTDCASCHLATYHATANPPHSAAGYSTACATCHNTTAWPGATFDHGATRFPLTGAHLATSCQLCHADNVYRGKATDCATCHQSDYSATTRPPHGPSGIGSACTSCHSTTAWIPGVYDHGVTAFPLTGAHAATTCAGCHGDGVYVGKPTDCASCHQADYAATTNPSHTTASFPTTCASCHTTTTWTGATFDHDGLFPIYSGKHRGKWSSCTSCHTSPSDYSQFTCLTCHEHRQSEMDDKHKGRSGYSYTSQACLACHPRGDG